MLRALKEDAELHLGQTVQDAVITVPAYFSDAQRKGTHAAGQLAGLNAVRLLNEPIAAALAYGLHDDAAEQRVMVLDLVLPPRRWAVELFAFCTSRRKD